MAIKEKIRWDSFGRKVRKKFFYKLLFGMVLFCIVPILAGNILFSYFFTDRIIEKYEIEDSDNLKGIMLNNSRMLNEFKRHTYFTVNSSMRYFANQPFHEDLTQYNRLLEEFSVVLNNTDYIDALFFYSEKHGYINALTRVEEGFSRNLESISLVNTNRRYISSWMPYFEEEYFFKPFYREEYMESEGSMESGLSYIIPARGEGGQYRSALIFNIRFDKVVENTGHILNNSGKNIYMIIEGQTIPVIENFPLREEQLTLIANASEKHSVIIGSREMIVNQSRDDEMGITYVSVIPRRELIRGLNAILTTYYGIIVVFMGLFIIFAWLYSRILYKPMENLLETVAQDLDNDVDISKMSEFQLVLEEHRYLISTRDKMKEELEANKIILRRQFLSALIKGRLLGDIGESIRRYEIRLEGRCFSVLLIYLEQAMDNAERTIAVDQWENWQSFHEAAEQSLRAILEKSGAEGYLCRVDRNQYGIILASDGTGKAALGLIDLIMGETDLNLHLSVSNSVDDLSRLNEAYEQAIGALHMGVLSNKTRVHYYSEIESAGAGKGDQAPYESRIMEFNKIIKTGGTEELEIFVDRMVNHAQKSYSDPMQILSYYIEQVTEIIKYIRTMTSIDCGGDLGTFCGRLYECRVEKEVRDVLCDTLGDLMGRWQSLKKTITAVDKNVESAMAYIEANYHKPISLEIVADSIGLNPSYLSRIFKKSRGRSFYHSLADIRMEKARDLLEKTEKTVATVAEEIGFGTAISFSRTFKKYYGCTPKEFRGNRE